MLKKLPTRTKQYVFSITLIAFISAVCFLFKGYIHYYIVALIFLVAISILAIVYDIIPVLISAILSGFVLNFFFINPILHYKIHSFENVLLFFIYLLIALVTIVLINKIRKQEKKLRDEEEKEKTIKLYNTLLNSLSHELRTPIATIIGSIDTLKESNSTLAPEFITELMNVIEAAALRLNQQVENLLSMSRLETGNLQLKRDWCDVNELIFLVLQKLSASHSHSITFHPQEELPYFKIDTGLMEQVLYGLIKNAVIYTPEDTKIEVEATIVEDKLQIIVRDNGSGIPKEDVERIFEKFYRLPNSKAGGSGLGLSIVKGFVDAHSGTIELNLPKQGGTEFVILIPAETSYINNLKNE